MAAPMPAVSPIHPLYPQIPPTPPPDHPIFLSLPRPVQPNHADVITAKDAHGLMGPPPQPLPSRPPMTPLVKTEEHATGGLPARNGANGIPKNVDPRQVAMVTRIAAFYQQRCQAIAAFQHQRCQQWANAHRQKSQEMMQAATLVVAWYVRDRIRRRRKRQRRRFRKGLEEKCASNNKVTKGEAVKTWVAGIPKEPAPSETTAIERPADLQESKFDMDRDAKTEKDATLLDVATNLINSQLTKVEFPMLGALSFDDDSDSDSDQDMNYGDGEHEEDEDEDEEYDDEEYEDEEDSFEYYDEIELGKPDDDDLSREVYRRTGSCNKEGRRGSSYNSYEDL